MPVHPNEPTSTPRRRTSNGLGFAAFLLYLISGGLLFVGALGALNTAFELDLSMRYRGMSSSLPAHWDEVSGLLLIGCALLLLTFFASAVKNVYQRARSKQRIFILAGALVFIVAIARGVQVLLLLGTYGSLLGYYCTDAGSLSDVETRLPAARPSELSECLFRASQYNRVELLVPLFEAGADFTERCPLHVESSLAFIEEALSLGVRAQSCSDDADLLKNMVQLGLVQDDERLAQQARLLLAAGWLGPDDVSQLASMGFPKTAAVLAPAH